VLRCVTLIRLSETNSCPRIKDKDLKQNRFGLTIRGKTIRSQSNIQTTGKALASVGTRARKSLPSHSPPDHLGTTDQNDFNPLVRNGHLQTILARFWPPLFDFRRYPGQACLFMTEPGVRVLAWLHQHQIPSISHGVRDTLVIVHGLEGSADAGYVLKTTAIALERGFDVLRLNIRTCGGTEHLSQKLYHSGLTNDLRSVCEQLSNRRLFIIGFSMGGNMTLKLAGEWEASTPTHIRGACVVSPPIDLSACAHRIGEKYNRIYERRFLKSLQKKLKKKAG